MIAQPGHTLASPVTPRRRLDFSGVTRQKRSTETPPPPDWIVPGYIERGTLCIVAGLPEVGKSTLLMRLVANLSNGLDWQGNPNPRGRRDETCWAHSEELTPHVEAKARLSGAAEDGVQLIPAALRDDLLGRLRDEQSAFALGQWMNDNGYTILVLDHLHEWGGIIDGRKESDVRPVLTTLRNLAERYKITVIAVWHNKKGLSSSAKTALNGSIALVGVPRTVIGCYALPRSDGSLRYLVARIKGNVGARPTSLEFRVGQPDKDAYPWMEFVATSELTADWLQVKTQTIPDAVEDDDGGTRLDGALDALFPDTSPYYVKDLEWAWVELGLAKRQLRPTLKVWSRTGGPLRELPFVANAGHPYTRILAPVPLAT